MFTKHMIVVEDNAALARNLIHNLQQQFPDFEIHAAESVAEAKRVLTGIRRKGHTVRVVIVDEALKDKARGSELLAYLQRYYPGIRKVMLASQATTSDLSKAINEGGVDRYVPKADYRNNHNLLFDAIRGALREHQQGPIYQALAEMLERAQQAGGGEEVLLVAAKKKTMTAAELLRHISEGTPLGQQHLKHFASLVQHAVQNPEAVLAEMAKVEKVREEAAKAAAIHAKKLRGKRAKKSKKHARS